MRLLFIVYLLLFHLFVGIVIVKTDILVRIQNKLGFTTEQEEITPFYYAMVGFHRRVDANIPDNSIIFLGDSLIQGLAISSIASPSINFGIGNDTTWGLIQRIPYYSSISKSKAIVIAIGVNDLIRRNNKEIINNYKKIATLIPDHIPIVFSAILPIDEALLDTVDFNKRIRDVNNELKKLCDDNQRLYFINITNQLTRPDGWLSEKFHIGDGIHLNALGNAVWIDGLKKGLLNATSRYNTNVKSKF